MDPMKLLLILLVAVAIVTWLMSRQYAKREDGAKKSFILMQASFVSQILAVIVFFFTMS